MNRYWAYDNRNRMWIEVAPFDAFHLKKEYRILIAKGKSNA